MRRHVQGDPASKCKARGGTHRRSQGRGETDAGAGSGPAIGGVQAGASCSRGASNTSTRLALLTFKDISEPLGLGFKTPRQRLPLVTAVLFSDDCVFLPGILPSRHSG